MVAVIDTGVDYNHPDLRENMWVNPREIPGNGEDDDGNGSLLFLLSSRVLLTTSSSLSGPDARAGASTTSTVATSSARVPAARSAMATPWTTTGTVPGRVLAGGSTCLGTHCAGTLGARGNNGQGVPPAWNC